MQNTQLQGGPSAPDEDMMFDPEVVDLINQLNLARQASDQPLTEEEQAQVLGYAIGEKEARKREAQSQFDEEAMAEVARAMKRRRITSAADFSGAHKMFAYGPEEQPNGVNSDSGSGFTDLMIDQQLLGLSLEFNGAHSTVFHDLLCAPDMSKPDLVPTYKPGFNLLESVCSNIWLAVEVAKHLPVCDIVKLYSTSKTFHNLLNQYWQSSIRAWAEHMAPSSFRIFYWKFFGCYTRKDPTGTTWEAPGLFADAIAPPPWATSRPVTAADKEVRSVPGLRYLAMLVKREVRVRDILAKLARRGHRLPSRCHEAVKKMWLLMDLPTNTLRRAFIRSTQLWTTQDIYNAQMFVIKLQMFFNEPIFGPDAPLATETILGSPQGLTPLWQMLRGKKHTDMLDAMQMRVRYLASDQAIHHFRSWDLYYDIPLWQLGRGHLEGWGRGNLHLSRPDELIIEEASRRNINLKDHFTHMAFWGHVDWQKRANLVPSEEEMYMSDDDLPALKAHQKGPDGILGNCGNVPFEYGEWKPEQALLARWDTLTEKERLALRQHIGHEETKMAANEDDDEGFWDLNEDELSRLNHDKKNNTSISAADTRDGEDDTEADNQASEGAHDQTCACERCEPNFDTNSHDDSCMCTECLDEVDILAEREDEDSDVEDNLPSGVQESEPATPTTIPLPQEILQNPALCDAWNSLRPEDRQAVTGSLARQREQERATAAASVTAARARGTTPRQFPNITDPVSLALLHKLDGIDNRPAAREESEVSSHASGDDDMDLDMVDESDDEDDDTVHETGDDAQDDASSDSSMDDDQLKALADLDYSDDELDFDMGNFQAMLTKGRDDGSYHYRAGGGGDDDDEEEDAFGVAHEADLRSPGLAAEMRMPDTINY